MSFLHSVLTLGLAKFPPDLSADSSDDYWINSLSEVSYVNWWRGVWLALAIAPLVLFDIFIANTLHQRDLALALFPILMTVPGSGVISCALAILTLIAGSVEKRNAKRRALVSLKTAHYSVWLFRLGVFAWITVLNSTPS